MTVDLTLDRPVTRYQAAPVVVAVLVLHEGETFLPRAVAALAHQRRRPDAVVVVDTGSYDDGLAVVTDLWPDDAPPLSVVTTDRGTTFAGAVQAALAAPGVPAGADWLWLVHDDAAPAPDALDRLLAEVETAPSVGVAGCKQVSWDDGQRLVDVGFTVSRLGALVTGMDRGEVDQGQHDARSDVLAVGTAGMLVRRAVWTALGGPDRGLRGARADLDLCRRARLAGHRVVVVPSAVVAHANASAAGRRPGSSWYRADRHDAIFLRLASSPALLLPVAVLWTLASALVRATTRLVLKQPQQSLDELVAPLAVLARPDRWVGARNRARRTRAVPAKAIRPLRATPRQLLRLRRDEIAAWIVPATRRSGAHAVDLAATAVRVRPWRRALAVLPVLLVAAAAAVLASPGLGSVLPAPESASRLWDLATSSWRPVGLGAAAAGDPLAQVLAVLSLPVDNPRWVVWLLLAAGPVLAALTAWVAARAVVTSWAVRAWAALAWAAAPPLLTALTGGRPGGVLAHVLLPLVALALLRAAGQGSVTAAAAAGLALTIVVAGAPQLAVPAFAVLVVLAVAVPLFGPRRRALLFLLTAVIPAVLLLPWWEAVLRRPTLLLGQPAGSLAAAASPIDPFRVAGADLSRAFGRLGHPVPATTLAVGLVAVLVTPVAVLALLALLRRRAAWTSAVLCWLAAAAGGATVLAVRTRAAGTDPGPAWSLVGCALLAATLVVAPALGRRLRALSFGIGHAGVAVLVLLCAVGPFAVLSAFTVGALRGTPQRPVTADVLPAIAAAQALGPTAARTLVLDVDPGHVRWSLARDVGPRLGAGSAEQVAAGADDGPVVVPVVGALLSDAGEDLRARLAALGVGSVLLLPPIDESAQQALDASPGLVRVAASGGAVLWRVEPPTPSAAIARVRVLAADGTPLAAVASAGLDVDTDLAAGPAGRTLVMAERADAGWHAALDGVALPRQTRDGWAQAFALPTSGGHLVVSHSLDGTGAASGLRVVALVLAVLIALPLPRVRGRVAPPPAPRRSRPVVRDPRTTTSLRLQPKVFDEDHPEHGDVEPLP